MIPAAHKIDYREYKNRDRPRFSGNRGQTRVSGKTWSVPGFRKNVVCPGFSVSESIDILVIGAGHNGLVCACYLVAKGLKVVVVERRDVVGGAAVTEEFHPGFRISTASYAVSLLNPRVARDLRLAEHGLRIVERPFANFLPLP